MKNQASKEKSGFHIGVTCPGCGSNLELQEDFFVLICKFCNSVLRIVMPEISTAYLIKTDMPKREIRFHIDRYLKKRRQPLTGSKIEIKAVYFPYWKINAIMLKVRNKKVELFSGQTDDRGNDLSYEKQMTDIRLTPFTSTVAACSGYENIPHSIGLRTEYIKMAPFSSENIDDDFISIPATKGWDQAAEELIRTVGHMGNLEIGDFGENLTEIFHPKGVIVYFPYFIVGSEYGGITREFIIDGISGRVLKYDEHSLFEEEPLPSDYRPLIFGQLAVDYHRCTNCGFDLPDEQSAVYICGNCNKLILMEQLPFRIDHISMVENPASSNDRMFPFWSLKMSAVDQGRIGPMFGGLYKSDRIVIPGFKMANFESMYKLSKRFSSAFKTLELIQIETRLDERFKPVSLSLSEALTMADVIIYRELVGKGIQHPVKGNEFQPDEIELFYAPFRPENYFYVDSVHGAITFEKTLIE